MLPQLAPSKILKEDLQIVLTPRGWGAQVSPDGTRLVFACAYSGTSEIWISELDGAHPVRVTSFGGPIAGSPRWSPDGRWIAFDVDGLTRGRVFVVSASGGESREIGGDDTHNAVPSWSRDGKWIYFASDRTGNWQVWKVPMAGGDPVRVTHQGGFAALESVDGTYVYFSKHRYPKPEIWRVPSEGGTEENVSSLLRPDTWADWSATPKRIYFVSTGKEGKAALLYFEFATKSIQKAADLKNISFYLSVSNDGKLAICESRDLSPNVVANKEPGGN